MVKILVFLLTFSCTSCSYLMTSRLLSECDRPNVYCDKNEQSEREFKKSAENTSLENDLGITAKGLTTILKPNHTENNQNAPPEYCPDDKKKVCTQVKGCFCE